MPSVKQQLTELKQSCLVTVYHRKNVTKAFRSYVVPLTIRPATMAFVQQPMMTMEGEGKNSIAMTFTYGNDTGDGTLGSIQIDDPVFIDIPYFDLDAKVVVSCFNELFIGDLAFLAMLIGMNHSSGSHCLMCMSKASEFNRDYQKLTMRTK